MQTLGRKPEKVSEGRKGKHLMGSLHFIKDIKYCQKSFCEFIAMPISTVAIPNICDLGG